MMEHFLPFSDYVHWQVYTNIPVPLLGLLICISHEVHLKESSPVMVIELYDDIIMAALTIIIFPHLQHR